MRNDATAQPPLQYHDNKKNENNNIINSKLATSFPNHRPITCFGAAPLRAEALTTMRRHSTASSQKGFTRNPDWMAVIKLASTAALLRILEPAAAASSPSER